MVMRLGILGVSAIFAISAATASADEAERNQCLEYDQVGAIHQLSENEMVLEVDGGTTLYHITVDDRCFIGYDLHQIQIVGSGEDTCMRTTDRVTYGQRECGIQDVQLIETEGQLDALLIDTSN